MRNNNYQINFTEMTITVSKRYLKEANIIGSAAYNELARLRKDLPDFQFLPREITKKQGKKTYGKLTYKVMEDFIKEYEEESAPVVLAEYERIKKLATAFAGQYAYVKTWFLKRYKDVFAQKEETEETAA